MYFSGIITKKWLNIGRIGVVDVKKAKDKCPSPIQNFT